MKIECTQLVQNLTLYKWIDQNKGALSYTHEGCRTNSFWWDFWTQTNYDFDGQKRTETLPIVEKHLNNKMNRKIKERSHRVLLEETVENLKREPSEKRVSAVTWRRKKWSIMGNGIEGQYQHYSLEDYDNGFCFFCFDVCWWFVFKDNEGIHAYHCNITIIMVG